MVLGTLWGCSVTVLVLVFVVDVAEQRWEKADSFGNVASTHRTSSDAHHLEEGSCARCVEVAGTTEEQTDSSQV